MTTKRPFAALAALLAFAASFARGDTLLDLPVDNSPRERSYIVENTAYYDISLQCRTTDGARVVAYRFDTGDATVETVRVRIGNSYKVSLSRDGANWRVFAVVDREYIGLPNLGWISLDVASFLDGAETFYLRSEHWTGSGGAGGCLFQIVLEGRPGSRAPCPELSARAAPAGSVAVDGVLGEEAWANASWAGNFNMHNTAETPSQPTYVAVVYDAENLYLGFKCYDIRIGELEALETVRDADIFRDNCVEVFLRPGGMEPPYWHLAVNASGVQYDSRAAWPGGESLDDRSWNANWSSPVSKHADRWELEIALPWSELGITPEEGMVFHANFTRFAGSHGELTTWAPLYGSFHQPDRFGRLVLGGTEARPSFGLNHRQLNANPPSFEYLMQAGAAPAARSAQARVTFLPADSSLLFASGGTPYAAVVDVDPENAASLSEEPLAAGWYLAEVDWRMDGASLGRQLLAVQIPDEDRDALKIELVQPVFRTEETMEVQCVCRIEPTVEEFEWSIADAAGSAVAGGVATADARMRLSLPVPAALGGYILSVQARGRPETQRTAVFRREAPLGVPTKFEIDGKGWWRKDGEPFFPRVVYLASASTFEEMTALGINAEVTGSDLEGSAKTVADNIQTLDLLHERGAYLMLHVCNFFRGKEDYDALRLFVSSLKDHPALMAWYTADEPSGTATSPATLRKAREIIHEIDPNHPVVGADNSPLMFGLWADTADAFTPDPYPVPNSSLGMVTDWIDRSFAAMGTGVSVGNVLQSFGQPFISRGPTEREIRNMTLQTLACGVRMVFWWAYGPMKEAQEWPVYAEMIRGTTALTPMLWGVEPERRREGDVCFSRFVSPKGEVVIAVNLADRSATAILPWADTPKREMPFGFGCARNGLALELEAYGCAAWISEPVPAAGATLVYEVPESEKAAFDLDTLASRRATGAVALPYAAGATLTETAPDGAETVLVSSAPAAGTWSWTAAAGGVWALANSLEGSTVFTARYPASAQGAGTVTDPAKIVDEDELADLDAGVGYVFRPCGADGLLDALEIPDGCVLASLGGGLYRLDVADGDCVCGADGAVFPLETAQTGPDRRMKTALKFLPFAYSGDDWGFDPVAASVLTFTSPTSAETAVACVGTGSLTPSFRLTSGVWTVALSGASSLSARIDIPNDGTFLKMR